MTHTPWPNQSNVRNILAVWPMSSAFPHLSPPQACETLTAQMQLQIWLAPAFLADEIFVANCPKTLYLSLSLSVRPSSTNASQRAPPRVQKISTTRALAMTSLTDNRYQSEDFGINTRVSGLTRDLSLGSRGCRWIELDIYIYIYTYSIYLHILT